LIHIKEILPPIHAPDSTLIIVS